jgi:hypothetical protein
MAYFSNFAFLGVEADAFRLAVLLAEPVYALKPTPLT